jgi:hypothetical protein
MPATDGPLRDGWRGTCDLHTRDGWRGTCDLHTRDGPGDQSRSGETLPVERNSSKTCDTSALQVQPSIKIYCAGGSNLASGEGECRTRTERPVDSSCELLGSAAEGVGEGEMVLDAGGAGAVGEAMGVEGMGHQELPPAPLEPAPVDACPFPGASLPLSAGRVLGQGPDWMLGHPSLAESHDEREEEEEEERRGQGDDHLASEHPPPLQDD